MNYYWTSYEQSMSKKQLKKKSWTSFWEVMNKFWTNLEQVINKSWTIYGRILNNSRTSPLKVTTKSYKSNEKVWTSHGQDIKKELIIHSSIISHDMNLMPKWQEVNKWRVCKKVWIGHKKVMNKLLASHELLDFDKVINKCRTNY